MEDERPSIADRLRALNTQLDALEHRTQVEERPPRLDRPAHEDIGLDEGWPDLWLLVLIQSFGALVFAMLYFRSSHPRSIGEWVLIAAITFLIGLGIYGNLVFNAALRRSAVRWVKRKIGSHSSDG